MISRFTTSFMNIDGKQGSLLNSGDYRLYVCRSVVQGVVRIRLAI